MKIKQLNGGQFGQVWVPEGPVIDKNLMEFVGGLSGAGNLIKLGESFSGFSLMLMVHRKFGDKVMAS